jgi:hypothetical protein
MQTDEMNSHGVELCQCVHELPQAPGESVVAVNETASNFRRLASASSTHTSLLAVKRAVNGFQNGLGSHRKDLAHVHRNTDDDHQYAGDDFPRLGHGLEMIPPRLVRFRQEYLACVSGGEGLVPVSRIAGHLPSF